MNSTPPWAWRGQPLRLQPRPAVARHSKGLGHPHGELATQPEDLPRYLQSGFSVVTGQMTARLEAMVARIESQNISANGWATPGATLPAAHWTSPEPPAAGRSGAPAPCARPASLTTWKIIVYLNRLSDTLWLMARQAEQTAPASS